MADITLSISEPVSATIQAVCGAYTATLNYLSKVRETASDADKHNADQIQVQSYWDFRSALQFLGIVGPPIVAPPK